jgi:hypothetical protein
MFHVNAKAGCTYVDLLTVCKRVGIKLDKARESVRRLKMEGHWNVRKKDGRTFYIPRLTSNLVISSVRGDREYYRWRGAMIDTVVALVKITPAEPVAMLGMLSRVWRDYTFTESARDIAKLVCVSHVMAAHALSKWKQAGNKVETPKATYAHSTRVSEANSGNPVNLQYSKYYTDTTSAVSRSEDSTKGRKEERKGSGEEERKAASLVPSPTPLAEVFREAVEKFGEQARSIIGKAAHVDYVSPDEIQNEMDDVYESGGDVRELAYALWRP